MPTAGAATHALQRSNARQPLDGASRTTMTETTMEQQENGRWIEAGEPAADDGLGLVDQMDLRRHGSFYPFHETPYGTSYSKEEEADGWELSLKAAGGLTSSAPC